MISDEKKEAYAKIMLGCKEGAINGSAYSAMVLGMWCHTLNQPNPLPPNTEKMIMDLWADGFAASIMAKQTPMDGKKDKKKKK